MRNALRHFVAEFVGTFAYVFFGGGAIAMIRYTNGRVGLLEAALAHGLIFAAMVSATMRISGHLNPAITIGFLATRRIEPLMGGVYVLAQVFGAIIAGYALRGLVPADVFAAVRGGGQQIALDVSFVQAFSLEFIATFVLVFVVFGTAVDPQAPRVGGLPIGLAITAGDARDRAAHRRLAQPRPLLRPRDRERRLRGAGRVLARADLRRRGGGAALRPPLPPARPRGARLRRPRPRRRGHGRTRTASGRRLN
jgi:aquaporin Z